MSSAAQRTARAIPVLVMFVSALGGLACKAREDAFFAKVFPCDATSTTDSCGTTRAGAPMTCFSARQLGGGDFCAETCNPSAPSTPGATQTCLQSGALLQNCQPTASLKDPTVGCPVGLSCYRTSLSADKGLCLALNVCAADGDCSPDPSRPVCAASILRSVLPSAVAPSLATDHLQCLPTGCKSGKTNCPGGEACLGSFLAFGMPVDDVCVPICTADLACPPAYVCLQNKIAAPGGPNICFPGLIGSRCYHPEDCLTGECLDVGVEFKVCSVRCSKNEQCAPLSSGADNFVCAGTPGTCLTSRPFDGANCRLGGACPTGQRCFEFSPFGLNSHGECRVPCEIDGKCPARGGLPHICLGANREGGCFPSGFGIPCVDTSECPAGLSCQTVASDPRSRVPYSPTICTVHCATDADCEADPSTKHAGFCGDGVCRLGGDLGTECDRDFQCITRRCDEPNRKCVLPVGL
jgi:hypothetical protein